MASKSAGAATAAVIRTMGGGGSYGPDLTRVLPVWTVCALVHVLIVLIFWLGLATTPSQTNTMMRSVNNPDPVVDDKDETTLDLTSDEFGSDPAIPLAYKNDRIEEVSVSGTVVPDEPVGLPGAQEGPQRSVPPPPGPVSDALGGGGVIGTGPAGAFDTAGRVGGFGGVTLGPGGFGGRSASTKEQALQDGGGSRESEAAVGLGLKWMALHQNDDGGWLMDRFHTSAREKPGLGGKKFVCNCAGQGMRNDTAATAFGVLPFLAAGVTHKNNNKMKEDYTKNVDAALRHLISHQDPRTGDLGGGMYAHGLATIALCEAYGLSADQTLKVAAQKAVDYIVAAQDPASGGWRYTPRSGGDTSVVGWQLMALKSAQMAGLKVPQPTLDNASKWLDSCEVGKGGSADYGYGYVGKAKTPTMTAVGLLCREYLGWGPKKPELITGSDDVFTHRPGSPGAINSMYFNYYATQVLHHMGGERWKKWNESMRDSLIAAQDQGRAPKRPHQIGSWGPEGDVFGGSGGRIMQTSLSLLTLEVYYRHLPLYRRDVTTGKEMENK